ncbi:hypothetical protein D3C73_993980 [compost metagenome]
MGKEVRIQTKPVDPRDLLYGDYVILNYEISQLPRSLWKEAGAVPDEGTTVYVVLKPDPAKNNRIYSAIGVYDKKPSVQSDEILLKGRIDYSFDKQLNVTYGLEKYYVPENTGKQLEQHTGDLIAKIKVAWGRSVIQELELPTP